MINCSKILVRREDEMVKRKMSKEGRRAKQFLKKEIARVQSKNPVDPIEDPTAERVYDDVAFEHEPRRKPKRALALLR
jgi:hypothetical protein